jgi:hypothetical protein
MRNAKYYNNNNNCYNKNETSYFVNKLQLKHKTYCNNAYSRLRILPVAGLQVNLALNVVVQLVPKLLMFSHLNYNINLLLRLVRVHNNQYNSHNLLLYSNNQVLSMKNLWPLVGNTAKLKILYFLFKLTSMPHTWMIVLLLSS